MDKILEEEDRTRPDASEGPDLGPGFWKRARVIYPEGPKKQITLRLDWDMVEWFKEKSKK